jgi:hypothetical protein
MLLTALLAFGGATLWHQSSAAGDAARCEELLLAARVTSYPLRQ